MGFLDIILLIIGILAVLVAGIFFLNRWASKKLGTQQDIIEKTKASVSIYVIDKRKDKAQNVTLPKAVMQNLPKSARFLKLHFVKAKVGPQIITLICEKNVFNALNPKKNYQVELSGIYIANVKGMKSKYEMKLAAKNKKKLTKKTS